ncbi:unnamed protein product, partial [Pleuronectes platessa]
GTRPQFQTDARGSIVSSESCCGVTGHNSLMKRKKRSRQPPSCPLSMRPCLEADVDNAMILTEVELGFDGLHPTVFTPCGLELVSHQHWTQFGPTHLQSDECVLRCFHPDGPDTGIFYQEPTKWDLNS